MSDSQPPSLSSAKPAVCSSRRYQRFRDCPKPQPGRCLAHELHMNSGHLRMSCCDADCKTTMHARCRCSCAMLRVLAPRPGDTGLLSISQAWLTLRPKMEGIACPQRPTKAPPPYLLVQRLTSVAAFPGSTLLLRLSFPAFDLVPTSATTGLVVLSRRPSSLYSRNPENSAVQERSRNSTKILRAGPCAARAETVGVMARHLRWCCVLPCRRVGILVLCAFMQERASQMATVAVAQMRHGCARAGQSWLYGALHRHEMQANMMQACHM